MDTPRRDKQFEMGLELSLPDGRRKSEGLTLQNYDEIFSFLERTDFGLALIGNAIHAGYTVPQLTRLLEQEKKKLGIDALPYPLHIGTIKKWVLYRHKSLIDYLETTIIPKLSGITERAGTEARKVALAFLKETDPSEFVRTDVEARALAVGLLESDESLIRIAKVMNDRFGIALPRNHFFDAASNIADIKIREDAGATLASIQNERIHAGRLLLANRYRDGSIARVPQRGLTEDAVDLARKQAEMLAENSWRKTKEAGEFLSPLYKNPLALSVAVALKEYAPPDEKVKMGPELIAAAASVFLPDKSASKEAILRMDAKMDKIKALPILKENPAVVALVGRALPHLYFIYTEIGWYKRYPKDWEERRDRATRRLLIPSFLDILEAAESKKPRGNQYIEVTQLETMHTAKTNEEKRYGNLVITLKPPLVGRKDATYKDRLKEYARVCEALNEEMRDLQQEIITPLDAILKRNHVRRITIRTETSAFSGGRRTTEANIDLFRKHKYSQYYTWVAREEARKTWGSPGK
jgi:hypothetical protein